MTRLSRLLSSLSVVALLGTAAPALAQAPDAFTYTDMISANRLGDPQVSPDGRWVLYSVTTTDVAANRRSGAIWLMDLQGEGGEGRKLALNEGGANTARWGSDGKIYFLSGRSGSSQLWRADADGTGPVQVTSLPLDVNAYRLSPGADSVATARALSFPMVRLMRGIAFGPSCGPSSGSGLCQTSADAEEWRGIRCR